MPPKKNIRYIIGSKILSYNFAPWIFMNTNIQISTKAIPTLTTGNSNKNDISSKPKPKRTSRINETQIYEITPITMDKPNH